MYTQDSLRESGYEGWVAWIDGYPVINPADGVLVAYDGCTPLLESVPHNPHLIQVASGHVEREVQRAERTVIDWKDLPHTRVRTLELYAFRGAFPHHDQPLLSIQAQPDRVLRWIQYKRTGLVVSGGAGGTGQSRLGISSWIMGYWDTTVGQATMWEIPGNGAAWPSAKYPKLEYSGRNHPCWPKPLGFAIAPHVLGLKAEDVPPPPEGFGLRPVLAAVEA